MELTNVQNVKAYLRIRSTAGVNPPPTDDDGLIQMLVDAANDTLTRAFERNLLSSTYTEPRDGTGTDRLVLANYPVTDVASVTLLDPNAFAGTAQIPRALTLGVDYTFDAFSIVLYRGGRFPKGRQNVTVTYTGGYATLPADIVHAATKWAAVRYREIERLGMKSKSIGGEVVLFDTSDLPPDVKAAIERHRRRIPVVPGSWVGV